MPPCLLCQKALPECLRDRAQMDLPEGDDDQGSNRAVHQIENRVVVAMLGERHRSAPRGRGDVEAELGQLSDHGEREHDNEDFGEPNRHGIEIRGLC